MLAILGIVISLVGLGPTIGWVLRGLQAKGVLRREQNRFKCIFGDDALLGSDFHVVHTNFTISIVDQNGKPVKHIYKKLGTRTSKAFSFSIENPVSGGDARALNHIAALIQTKSRKPIRISTDYDLDAKPDISCVSFGGPMSNYKTKDTLDNDANDLVSFDERGKGGFVNVQTGDTIVEPKPSFDYGLILKLHPTDHPKRTWLVCAGYDEWGTSGAAWYLANNWEDIYQNAKQEPFAVVVEVERRKDESAQFVWGKSAGRVWEKPPHTKE